MNQVKKMTQKEAYEFYQKMHDIAFNTPMMVIWAVYGFSVPINSRKKGAVNCPFCNAEGSVKESYDVFTCWKHTCTTSSKGKNGVKPVELIMKVLCTTDVKYAVFDIAMHLNETDIDTVNAYYYAWGEDSPFGGNTDTYKNIPKVDFSKFESNHPQDAEIASDAVLHRVYSLFKRGESIIPGGKHLSQKHQKYLNERYITDDLIKKGQFFTMPSGAIIKKFTAFLKEKCNINDKALEHVPGFYRDKHGNITFKQLRNAIGMPIFNANGILKGIQVRLDKPLVFKNDNGDVKTLRYIWFSSSESYKIGGTGGVSPGTPIDIVYPEVPTENISNTLYITEGKFKSLILSKQTNAIVASVQGVGNWKSINDEISAINSIHPGLITRVEIVFDADLATNTKVNYQAKIMSDNIKEAFPSLSISYGLWNPNNGKGIDDLILNKEFHTVKSVSKSKYDQLYELLLTNIRSFGFELDKLSEEQQLVIFENTILKRI